MIVPIILEALGTVASKLLELLKKLEIEHIIRNLQTAVSISTTAALRRVLISKVHVRTSG